MMIGSEQYLVSPETRNGDQRFQRRLQVLDDPQEVVSIAMIQAPLIIELDPGQKVNPNSLRRRACMEMAQIQHFRKSLQ
jgi:hypothetical protein